MRTLYVKFVVVTISIMLLSGLIAFFLSNTYYQHKLKPENDEKITAIAESITTYLTKNPTVDMVEYLESIASVGYQMYLVDDSLLGNFYGAPFRDDHLPEDAVDLVLSGDVYHGILEFPQETFVTGFFANELKNTIGVPVTHDGRNYGLFIRPDIKLLFNEMHFLFGWLLGLTILLSIILVAISTKYLVKPISELSSATKLLAKEDFDVEVETGRQDELGELAQNFTRMAKKLKQIDTIRKEFISNISHDIRSPLANIKGYTKLLEKEGIREKDRAEYISIIHDEISRLSRLTDQLLLLASLDRKDDLMKRERFNLGEQLKELVRNYQWQINEKGIHAEFKLPPVELNGDPSLLHTVWDNLLTNAIKYNKPNGSMNLSIQEKEKTVILRLEDTGIGLRNTEIERIFDRFYRANTSRTSTIEGTGLGLSIVWTIVQLHDGQIHVNSKIGEGTIFTIELPQVD